MPLHFGFGPVSMSFLHTVNQHSIIFSAVWSPSRSFFTGSPAVCVVLAGCAPKFSACFKKHYSLLIRQHDFFGCIFAVSVDFSCFLHDLLLPIDFLGKVFFLVLLCLGLSWGGLKWSDQPRLRDNAQQFFYASDVFGLFFPVFGLRQSLSILDHLSWSSGTTHCFHSIQSIFCSDFRSIADFPDTHLCAFQAIIQSACRFSTLVADSVIFVSFN